MTFAFQLPTPLSLSPPTSTSLKCCYRPTHMTIAPPRSVTLPKQNVVHVSPTNGFIPTNPHPKLVPIAECFIDLPKQKIYELDLESHRPAQAVIYALESIVDSSFTHHNKVIVFLHGFSQRPRNYSSTLRFLAAKGYIVIAPRVWLFDTAFAKVERAKMPDKWFASQPAKLQTALLIDSIKCVKWAVDKLSVRNVALVGHSMGAAMALVAAQALGTRVSSVATLAPAVGPTEITPVNQYLSLDNGDVDKFASLYKNIPVLLAHGENDKIVRQSDVDRLFDAFDNADRPDIVGDIDITCGSHVGFEDTLDVDVPVVKRLDWLLFKIIDFFVFGLFDIFSKGKEQLEYTKSLLHVWLEATNTHNVDFEELQAKVRAIDEHAKRATARWGV